MQPYFFPYIGYFQLISAVDIFIIYDNIKYTKKGWINRNRILQNGKDIIVTLPLKSDSDTLDICQRELAANFNRVKLLNQISGAYRGAPYFSETLQLVEQIVLCKDENLFRFLHNSIVKTCAYLDINTEIRISSEIEIDHSLKNQEKVLALCNYIGARTYINAIGGIDLYSKNIFRLRGVDLKFIESKPFDYQQFGSAFVPWLSVIDVLMFNPVEIIVSRIAGGFDLV